MSILLSKPIWELESAKRIKIVKWKYVYLVEMK